MSQNEQEKTDLELLKTAITKAKTDGFDLLAALSKVSQDKIHHYGHKTVADAVLSRVNSISSNIEKMVRAFEKKYPG